MVPRSPRCPVIPTGPGLPVIPPGPGRPLGPCTERYSAQSAGVQYKTNHHRDLLGFGPPSQNIYCRITTHTFSVGARRSLLSWESCGSNTANLTRATGRTSLTTVSSCSLFANGSNRSGGSARSLQTRRWLRSGNGGVQTDCVGFYFWLHGQGETYRWARGSDSAGGSGETSSTLHTGRDTVMGA